MSTALSTDRSPDAPGSPNGPAVGRSPETGGPDRLVTHHLLLAIVLAVVLVLAGTGSVWSADEGALLYQAVAVAEGRGWTFTHPFPAVDPDGTWFPIHLAGYTDDGDYIVLGKHALFVRLVGVVHGVGGYAGVLGLSAVAQLAAAAASARLAGRIDRRAAVPALWLTGVASPLFLSAYVAWAHTLGAALVGWGLVGLTTGPGRDDASGPTPPASAGSASSAAPAAPARLVGASWWRSISPAHVAGAVALGAAVLVRTEALLAGVAVTAALGWPAVRAVAGGRRPYGLGPAVLAGAATVVGFVVDRVTAVPRSGPVRPPGDRWGGLAGRAEAFAHTWLRPDFSREPRHLLLLAAAGLTVGAGIAARRRRADHPLVGGLLLAAAMALAARFLSGPTALVPGLVIAFPLLFAALALLTTDDLRRGRAGTLLGAVGLFWLAVAATQYRHGGGGEWGGRYFALGLPAIVAVAAGAGVRTLAPLDRTDRRRVVGLAATIALLPVTMGILGLADVRVRTEALVDRVDESLVAAGDGDDRPVVVSTLPAMGRWAWADVDRSRWLLVLEDELTEAAPALRSVGVEQFVLVTDEPDATLATLAPWYGPITPTAEADDGPRLSLDRVVIPVRATG